ncbi:MAG: polyprenyl synthetase family protein [Oscillospiraceae bacterium]|nr:polyprenyl synthetase family protein [Oscillospiraceae bacterium]
MRHEDRLDQYVRSVDEALETYIPAVPMLPQARLIEAMQYSLFAGGKRIRPVILLEFCRVSGGDWETALPFACALEMIHTYSLIHDDLPCMDDDTMRRGRPCSHVMFGEATALLAGDALLTAAFETMLDPGVSPSLDPDRVRRAAHVIAAGAGAYGMAGGQQLDIEGGKPGADPLNEAIGVHSLKTGAMMAAAAQAGCILGGATETQCAHAVSFAKALGIAFQIRDDILDVEGDSDELGKTAGKDAAQGKLTFVPLKGMEECKALVASMTSGAIGFLPAFAGDAAAGEISFLTWLANEMMNRSL